MKNALLQAAIKLNRERKQRMGWQKAVSVLSALVVFCTTYALILPAITMEKEAVCGFEAHEHSEDCYEQQQVYTLQCSFEVPEEGFLHSHNEFCYDSQGVLVCSLPEIAGHVHETECFDVDGNLICEVPEMTAHDHTEECLVEGEPVQIMTCQLAEHIHEDACYPLEDSAEAESSEYLCGIGEHMHGESCYGEAGERTCTIVEHMHEVSCMVADLDMNADVELQTQWEAAFANVTLTGNWSADVLAIAETQLDYHESVRNVVLEGEELKGYTRYGAWYGDTYGDWGAMFVSFCLNYAGVEEFPLDSDSNNWSVALEEAGLYRTPDTYMPKPGDVIFFDREQRDAVKTENGIASDYVGLVAELIPAADGTPAQIKTIEGNHADKVSYATYYLDDSVIIGYGELPAGEISVLTYHGEDYTVTVNFDSDANIPATAELVVREILSGTKEYNDYYQQSVDILGGDAAVETEDELDVSFARFFDISFVADGQVVEPAAPVDIRIYYNDGIDMMEGDDSVAVHFAKEGIEVLEAETSQSSSDQVDTFAFTQESFSVTGTLVTAAARAADTYTTVSPNSLDSSGSTQYVVYTKLGDAYYAIDGNGDAQRITLADDGSITSAVNNNLLWTFTGQAARNTHVIRNVGTGRYMHSYTNNGGGVTTAGAYSSILMLRGEGKDIRFSVQSNTEFSSLTQNYGQVDFTVTQNGDAAAEFYLAAMPQTTYHVWFDGTNGDIMSLYGSDNTYQAVPADNNTITLPATWKSPSKYNYKLNGWYDIVSHTYYPAGAQVTITQNTVFYADWVAETYDIGVQNEHTVDSLDTNSFITTYVFDYNSLFNTQSLTHLGSISASGHSEAWTMVQTGTVPYNEEQTLDFAFVDYDTDGPHFSYADNRNIYNYNRDVITEGILDHVSNVSGGKSLVDLLFDPNTPVIGKTYLGTGNYLYQYMDSTTENYDGHDGYYYFHSRLNAAAYNQSEDRFYLYDYLERTSDSEKDGGDGEYSDFLPFNSVYANHQNLNIDTYTDPDTGKPGYQFDAKDNGQGSSYNNAGTNYWFGIRSDIEFYLPNDSGDQDEYGNYGNISTKGHHMIFEFHGDDDLWIFVDGQLMLDVGGIHGVEYGQIDFSTGTVVSGEGDEQVTRTFAEVLGGGNITEGTHTMTVYYMERGSSQSNCSIYFNIAPRYDLEITKQDIFTAEALDGTEFTIYTDEACTHPAELWSSYEAHLADMADGTVDNSISTIKVVGGVAKCWGMSAGKTYYIRETKAPDGYPPTDDMIRITLNNRGTATIETTTLHGSDQVATEGFAVVEQDVDDTLKLVSLLVTNQTDADTTQVRVQKSWDESSTNIPENITVYLTVNGKRVGRTAILHEGNGWAYTWTGLPKYEADGITEVQYQVEEVLVSGYTTTQDVPLTVVERVDWIRTDAMEDSITYVLVNANRALSYDGQYFQWVTPEYAQSDEGVAAQWHVTTNNAGFRLTNGNGYSITYDVDAGQFTGNLSTDSALNEVLYFASGRLLAQQNDIYYHFGEDGAALSSDGLSFTLYRKEVLTGTLVNILNIPVQEEDQTFLEVNKVWADNGSHYNDPVTIHLYADGKDTGRTLILDESNNWQGSFEGLPYYQEDGVTPVEYTVVEDPVHNYSPSYSDPIVVDGRNFTIWASVDTLESDGIYRFTAGSYSLACDASGQLISKANDPADTYQQWQTVRSGNNIILRNVATNYYLRIYNSSISTTQTAGNASAATLSNGILRIGSRYIMLDSSGVDSSGYSNNGTVLAVTRQTTTTGRPGTSVTVTNTEAQYQLPSTGGGGTYFVTLGGLFVMTAAFMYSRKPESKPRRRGRS